MDYIVYKDSEEAEVLSSKESVFLLIRDEQFIESIWEADKADGRFRDVTEDLAREFINKYGDDYDKKKYVPEFVIQQAEDSVDEYFERSSEQTINNNRHNAGYTYGQAGRI